MASVEKRPDGKWRARYRPVPGGRQIARHFRRKIDAERWLTEQQSRVNRGDWTAPELGRIAVNEWAETWLASKKTLKGRTYTSYESVWRTLVKPRWGDTRLDRVTHGEVVRWVAELTERGLSPSRITQALLCLKQVLALAVMDGRLARNAAEHVKPPRPRKAEPRFLTHEQVHDLAEACGQYRVFVLTAAYTGLRWGELRALRVKRIDLERGRIDVAEAMPERSLELDTPKNHKRRTVPIPGFVVDELEKQVQGKGPDDLVFTNSAGGMLDNTNFRRNIWNPAARSIGLDGFTPHDLRHTTASLAVSAGANVKALQRLLGHASASMTLDVYSALFDSDLDAVAERLGKAAEDWLRTRSARVASLDARRVL